MKMPVDRFRARNFVRTSATRNRWVGFLQQGLFETHGNLELFYGDSKRVANPDPDAIGPFEFI